MRGLNSIGKLYLFSAMSSYILYSMSKFHCETTGAAVHGSVLPINQSKKQMPLVITQMGNKTSMDKRFLLINSNKKTIQLFQDGKET